MENFSNLELHIMNATVSYSQVTLNDALLEYYFKKTSQGVISNIPSTIVDYYFIPNPVPRNVKIWSLMLPNIIVPERLFFVFQSDFNRLQPKGNNFYFENMGISEIMFSVQNSSLNRFQQKRISAFANEKTVLRSSEEYARLTENERFNADLLTSDMILDQNILNSGKSNTGINQSSTFICNHESIYGGNCVYSISTCAQMSTNSKLKEITKRGNVEITINFMRPTASAFYCSVFCLYPGDFLVSIFCTNKQIFFYNLTNLE